MENLTALKNLGLDASGRLDPQASKGPGVLDLLLALVRQWKLIGKILGISLAVALIATFLIPKEYRASTKILPPQKSPSISQAVLGQLAPLAAVAGRDLSLKDPNDLYIAMLESHRVEDKIIQQFKLQDTYREKTLTRARRELEKRTSIDSGKDGIITVSVTDRSPGNAAALANAYASGLAELSQSLAVTEAGQRRLFFERQVAAGQQQLSEAQQNLAATQEKTGILQLDAQSKVILETIAQLNAQIAAKEVQRSRLLVTATPENPELKATNKELEVLQAHLAQLERSNASGSINIQVPTSKVPRATMEYLNRLREVKYRETMLELLQREYESARIDEAKEGVLIQVLDKAAPPEEKYSPRRGLILLVVGALSLLVGIIAAFVRDAWERAWADPETRGKLSELRGYIPALRMGNR